MKEKLEIDVNALMTAIEQVKQEGGDNPDYIELKCDHNEGKSVIVEFGKPVLAYCPICYSPVDI